MNVAVEVAELRAAVAANRAKDSALEAKACALMKQYGFLLPKPAKEFFGELAVHLEWTALMAILNHKR
jgi:hypothetical protein